MSPIGAGGGGLSEEAGRTAGFVATRELYPADVRFPLEGKSLERPERRLPLAAQCQEPRLPAAEGTLVAEQEPEHHVDPRVLARDAVGLAQVGGLLRVRDAEEAVGRSGLVAVLGDPEALLAVEPRQLLDQVVDVAEADGRLRPRPRARRLARLAVVRMVSVGVEALHPGALGRPEERRRRHRGPARAGRVVAPGCGDAARDLLAPEQRRLDPRVDRVADLRVVHRALDHPAATDLPVLLAQENG